MAALESTMSQPTPEDLRSAAQTIENEWAGWHRDDRTGDWNGDGRGTPCWKVVADLRVEADRLEAER